MLSLLFSLGWLSFCSLLLVDSILSEKSICRSGELKGWDGVSSCSTRFIYYVFLASYVGISLIDRVVVVLIASFASVVLVLLVSFSFVGSVFFCPHLCPYWFLCWYPYFGGTDTVLCCYINRCPLGLFLGVYIFEVLMKILGWHCVTYC